METKRQIVIEQSDKVTYLYLQPDGPRFTGVIKETKRIDALVDLDSEGRVFGIELLEKVKI